MLVNDRILKFPLSKCSKKNYENHSLCQIYRGLHIATFDECICPKGKGRCCSIA